MYVCDGIISIDKDITENIYYKGNLLVIWDYLIEKAILHCNNDKIVLNFLIYVFMLSSYIEDWRHICSMMPL